MDTINQCEIQSLIEYFSKTMYRAKYADDIAKGVMQKCIELAKLDYNVSILDNSSGDLCAHYPSQLILMESENNPSGELIKNTIYEGIDPQRLRELITKARSARCRTRFPMPVIFFQGKYICRSATLSGGPEIYGRSGFDYFFAGDQSENNDEDNEQPNNCNNWVLCDQVRKEDIKLLKALNVGTIVDFMVEKKKVKFGLNVTSSEKVDKENRYSQFTILSLPYPGCEFFREFRDQNYSAENLYYNWGQTHVDAEIIVPQDNITERVQVKWKDYKKWNLPSLTENYLMLLLGYVFDSSSGVLVHCISGWDRTPLFISLLRICLWADGAIHKSLTPIQMLYFTIAYDWLLFGHDLQDRKNKGEDIFYFCFHFLKFVMGDEFSSQNDALENSEVQEPIPEHNPDPSNLKGLEVGEEALEGSGPKETPEIESKSSKKEFDPKHSSGEPGTSHSSQVRCRGKVPSGSGDVPCEGAELEGSELIMYCQGSNHSLNSSWSSISSKSQEINPSGQSDDLINMPGGIWIGEGGGSGSHQSSASSSANTVIENVHPPKMTHTSPVSVPSKTSSRQRNESTSSLNVGSAILKQPKIQEHIPEPNPNPVNLEVLKEIIEELEGSGFEETPEIETKSSKQDLNTRPLDEPGTSHSSPRRNEGEDCENKNIGSENSLSVASNVNLSFQPACSRVMDTSETATLVGEEVSTVWRSMIKRFMKADIVLGTPLALTHLENIMMKPESEILLVEPGLANVEGQFEEISESLPQSLKEREIELAIEAPTVECESAEILVPELENESAELEIATEATEPQYSGPAMIQTKLLHYLSNVKQTNISESGSSEINVAELEAGHQFEESKHGKNEPSKSNMPHYSGLSVKNDEFSEIENICELSGQEIEQNELPESFKPNVEDQMLSESEVEPSEALEQPLSHKSESSSPSWQYVSSTGSLRSTASGSTVSSNSRSSGERPGESAISDSVVTLTDSPDSCFINQRKHSGDHSQCGSSCAMRRERLDQIRKLFFNCYCQSIGHNLKDGSEASGISNIFGNIAGKIMKS